MIAVNLQRRHARADRAIIHCTTVTQLLERLEPETALCIVADAALPDMDVLELLHRLHSLDVYAPVLCMAEECGIPRAVALMKAGAYDCIERGGPLANLLARLDAFIEEAWERGS